MSRICTYYSCNAPLKLRVGSVSVFRKMVSSSGRPVFQKSLLFFRKTKTQHAQIYQEQSVNMLPGSPQHTGGAKSTKIERHIFRLPEDQPVFQTTRVFRKTGWSSGRWKRIPHVTTVYDYECSSSTLGTQALERCQRPVPVRSSNLLLVLDAPSAGGEGPVVWNVIRTHTRSRNTCNVKSGRLPVHLGLDPARHQLYTYGTHV